MVIGVLCKLMFRRATEDLLNFSMSLLSQVTLIPNLK